MILSPSSDNSSVGAEPQTKLTGADEVHPYDRFANFNNDLGPCNRIHDPKLKERRVRPGLEPFVQEEEPLSLSDKFKNLSLQLDALVEDGKVDDAIALLEEEVTERGREGEGLGREEEAVATTMGTIHPPPDITTIIEKTAMFVARNGIEFEKLIRSCNTNNRKFDFLNASDPYHAYYQHRMSSYHTTPQYSAASGAFPEPPGMPLMTSLRPPAPLTASGLQHMIIDRPPSMPVPPHVPSLSVQMSKRFKKITYWEMKVLGQKGLKIDYRDATSNRRRLMRKIDDILALAEDALTLT